MQRSGFSGVIGGGSIIDLGMGLGGLVRMVTIGEGEASQLDLEREG